MRILHLISEKTWRGGEQQAAYLIEELQRHGVENFVGCRKGSRFEAYAQRMQIPYVTLSFSKVFPFASATKLKNYVNSHHIQLMHLHTSHAHTLGVLAHVLGAKAELVLSRRVEFEIGRNPLSQFKYNYSGIRRILCVSDSVRQQMAASIKDSGKCVTVYSGINLEAFEQYTRQNATYLRRKYSIPTDHLLIGNVSALDKHKDYYTFLDTVKLLKESGVKARYFAIGSGPLEQEIKQYAAVLGLAADVIFTGFVSNVKEILPELDLFLFTTVKEGLGSSVLDAFACSVPVVATEAGGIPEMVKHGITGLLAPIRRPDLLAQQVLQVLQNSTLRNSLTENARQEVLKFSKEHTAQRTLAVYKEILEVSKI
ncbi:glycosyltransferase family 4 protein [Pontibacter liquoris]|uniref:glycosyltransferase family 4 protein n=1 Tax=Pontibacter liquoris TaxID=2905677 RepID=UPI001FA6BAFE|nr:glycosyltransferase family 4 protein [Pontibacter liquoris]